MIKKSKPETFIVLDYGRQVPEWIYNIVKQQSLAFLPHMLPGHRYTLETICGNEFWDRPIPRIRVWAGMCMAHMVANGFLPFEFAETGGKRTKQYQLR